MSKKIYLLLAFFFALKLVSAQANSTFNKLKDQAVSTSNNTSTSVGSKGSSTQKNKTSDVKVVGVPTVQVVINNGNAGQSNKVEHHHHAHTVCPLCQKNNGQYHKALNEERKRERKEAKEEHKHGKHGKGHGKD